MKRGEAGRRVGKYSEFQVSSFLFVNLVAAPIANGPFGWGTMPFIARGERSRIMKAKAVYLIIAMFVCSAVLVTGAPVNAQERGPVEAQKIDNKAKEVMKRMADCLAKAKGFSVTVETG